MKFAIKKRVAKTEKETKKLITPKKVLNEKYVSTGYCSSGTPYINKKEVPLLKEEPPKQTVKAAADLNTSAGSFSPKNLLYRLKNTTKMKHKSKQASNALGGNMGSKTLKSVGVSFGNLFKPSKRISKNDKNVIVDASRQLSEVYFPPIYRVADKNFKSQQILSEISCHVNKTPQQIHIDFISKSCQVNRKSAQLLSSISRLSQASKTDLNIIANINLTPSLRSAKSSSRKTQPSMGIEAMVMKCNKKSTLSSASSQCISSELSSSNTDSDVVDKRRQVNEKSMVDERFKTEEIYQNSSFMNKFNSINQTYLIEKLNHHNSTLKPQENDLTLSNTNNNNEFSFDKYLVPSVCVDSSPDMEPISTSTSMSSLQQQAQHSNTDNSFLLASKPTPYVKFGMQQRVKKLRTRSSNTSMLDFNNIDSLVDSQFNFENYESDV